MIKIQGSATLTIQGKENIERKKRILQQYEMKIRCRILFAVNLKKTELTVKMSRKCK